MAILRDASREDPWGALIANTILKTRRLVRKSTARCENFFRDITRMAEKVEAGDTKAPFPGPVYALVGALADIGVKLDVGSENHRLLATPRHGPTPGYFASLDENCKSKSRAVDTPSDHFRLPQTAPATQAKTKRLRRSARTD